MNEQEHQNKSSTMQKPPLTCCRCGEKRQFGNPMYYCPAPICDIKGLPVCHGCFKDLGSPERYSGRSLQWQEMPDVPGGQASDHSLDWVGLTQILANLWISLYLFSSVLIKIRESSVRWTFNDSISLIFQ